MIRSALELVLCGVSVAAVITGCGEGHAVNLGSLTVAAPESSSPPSAPGSCGADACADFTGSKTFVEQNAMNAPPGAFDAAEQPPGTDAASEPVILYPNDETLLPTNLSRLRFAWLPGASELFALDFVGPRTSVRIVTTDTSFSATDDEWAWIAESNRGQRVDLVVRAVDLAAPSKVWRSRSIALFFSGSALEGTVYYWSTAGRGLMQASATDARAVRVFTDPGGADAAVCTGCHTVSRDGTRLAAGYDKNQIAELSLVDGSVIVALADFGVSSAMAPAPAPMMNPDAKPPPAPDAKPPPVAWSTFSPDGTRLLVAGGGKLRLIDADTGAPIGSDQGTVALPAGTTATHPDWSPLGDRVAVTLNGKGGDKQTEGGSIAIMPYAADAFGDPETLVAAAGGMDNNFFPSFSPDGRYLAFVNAQGGSQDTTSARLELVDLATGNVRDLTRLNERVNNADGTTAIGNTMPSWGPISADGTYWLSFSSLRAYAELRPTDPKRDQLWIAGIDPTLDDPGYAAFWAPFQEIAHGNHRAFWTPLVASRSCATSGPCADREICDNGIDDDCDCVIDDCSQEICDDGIDNDGDGKIDKMDPDCAP
jgi:TolB protein